MKLKKLGLFVVVLFSMLSGFASGHEAPPANAPKEVKQRYVDEVKEHHLHDDHSFTIMPGVSIPLPVILFDDGVQFFMSSNFKEVKDKHGHVHTIAESGGNYYTIHHGHMYKCNEHGHVEYDKEGHAVGKVLDFSITKNVVIILLMSVFLFFFFKKMAQRYGQSAVPQKSASFFEPIIVFIRDDIAIPNIGKNYEKYMGYLLTVFFFVWFLNLAGLTPFGVSVTNNIAVTASLAILTFLITNLTANKHYWGHIFWMPGVPKPMRIVLAPIELLGIFIKPFSLMIRLFANMTAGHIVIMSILGLMYTANSIGVAAGPSALLTFVLSLLELLVAALQAYIFTMLSALYFGSANEEPHH
ncbi:F0F1 ATP synthase subunit A [Parvicella tangerina]|uniref:ATP synthase subunit a n=1 Tax=Parvicella tangerina TaxID=2829795 RepID=A0A916NTA4_9FLAO|nr:F0F1 ATP synthase subunit A [Parvicella tangerina]CAG5085556.1 ATP synthase subunit a [Parvicella tangerina]